MLVSGEKGDEGYVGSPGIEGPQGHKGDTGFSGRHGEVGDFGLQGDIGLDGAPGNSNLLRFVSYANLIMSLNLLLCEISWKFSIHIFFINEQLKTIVIFLTKKNITGLKGLPGDRGAKGLRGPSLR